MHLTRLTACAIATAISAALPAAYAATIRAPAELPAKQSVADVIKASSPADWRALDPQQTLYMDTALGRVIIELAPEFAPKHVANIKALVAEQYYDGLAITRAQDNWVAQWGDPDEKNPKPIKHARRTLPGEFTVPLKSITSFTRLKDVDGYAPQVGHSNGFPSARDPKSGTAWLTHCYATVGVGRDVGSDSGGGTELYAVIGQSPRHLDRDITVVGRVVSGMPLLATLPRGTAPMGFYDSPEKTVPIKSVRLAADLPLDQRVAMEVMRTDSAAYQAVLEAQRNRGGPWSKVQAGHIDLCNAPIPVREVGK